MNDPKPSQKIPLLILLGVLLIGIPLTVVVLQQTQFFKQFAWATQQKASAACAPERGGAIITVEFTNTEQTKAMDVVAKDLQSGKTVDLGTIEPKETKTGEIETESKELAKGGVEFTLKWSDGSAGIDKRLATYDAVEACEDVPPFCPANPEIGNEGVCKWEPVEGAKGYEVEIIEKESGDVIKKEVEDATASQSAFPMVPGKAYECKVSAINACDAKGPTVKSPEKVCEAPTPTPTEPVCPAPPQKQGICVWDELEGAEEYKVAVKDPESGDIIVDGTVKAPQKEFKFTADPVKKYVCSVIPVGKCSEGPPAESPPTSCTVPSPSPTPTTPVTPSPSSTPSPTPTVPPSPTPIPPSPTPTLPPPTPTPTVPPPTPTPIVIVRIPPNTAPPTNPPVQRPPVIVQQPPVVVQQPPVVVQQPPVGGGQPPAQQQVPPAQVVQGQPSPAPTMKPTGALSDSLALVGASVILLLVGSLAFFII